MTKLVSIKISAEETIKDAMYYYFNHVITIYLG